MEGKTIIEAVLGKIDKVFNSNRGVLIVKFSTHGSLGGFDYDTDHR
jgi:hypothetical protein